MHMIELTKKCECGSLELSTHQQHSEPTMENMSDIIYGYCSECGKEYSSKVGDCKIYHE